MQLAIFQLDTSSDHLKIILIFPRVDQNWISTILTPETSSTPLRTLHTQTLSLPKARKQLWGHYTLVNPCKIESRRTEKICTREKLGMGASNHPAMSKATLQSNQIINNIPASTSIGSESEELEDGEREDILEDAVEAA